MYTNERSISNLQYPWWLISHSNAWLYSSLKVQLGNNEQTQNSIAKKRTTLKIKESNNTQTSIKTNKQIQYSNNLIIIIMYL